jgi:hypothetical protein
MAFLLPAELEIKIAGSAAGASDLPANLMTVNLPDQLLPSPAEIRFNRGERSGVARLFICGIG